MIKHFKTIWFNSQIILVFAMLISLLKSFYFNKIHIHERNNFKVCLVQCLSYYFPHSLIWLPYYYNGVYEKYFQYLQTFTQRFISLINLKGYLWFFSIINTSRSYRYKIQVLRWSFMFLTVWDSKQEFPFQNLLSQKEQLWKNLWIDNIASHVLGGVLCVMLTAMWSEIGNVI